MTTTAKEVRIKPGVDLERAVRCVALYLESENATLEGLASLTGYHYSDDPNTEILVYSRAKSIIVRKATT